MYIDEAKQLLIDKANAFVGRHHTRYGQMALRLDDKTYIMTRDNLRLTDITENDINVFDINSGDLGKLFNERPDVNAAVFSCTQESAKFSNENSIMYPALDDLAQIVGPDVKVIETASAPALIKALNGRNACFIKNAGVFAIGTNMDNAISALRIVEKNVDCELFQDKLGGIKRLSTEKISKMSSFYREYSVVNKTGTVNYIGHGETEFKLRSLLIECGKQLCKRSLVQGTWGNLSVRLNEHEMLISPSGMNYFEIKVEDIVKLDLETLDYGLQRVPSSEAGLHAAIYKAYPDCGAIIHTHSNGCSVFAACHAGFKIEHPDLTEIIGDLRCTEYASPGSKELTDSVLKALENSHACIMANHGSLFYGDNLDLVLSIADAVEAKACNLLGMGA